MTSHCPVSLLQRTKMSKQMSAESERVWARAGATEKAKLLATAAASTANDVIRDLFILPSMR
jgi:hypothetical protein